MGRPGFFLHIFKAGGTTVTDWLRQHYEVTLVGNRRQFEATDHTPLGPYRQPAMLRGHVAARDAIKYSGSRILFTMLRRPESQLMSALWQIASGAGAKRHAHPHLDLTLSRAALIVEAQKLSGTAGAAQSTFLMLERVPVFDDKDLQPRLMRSVLKGLNTMDAVGITERMRDSLRLFAWHLGLPAPNNIGHIRDSGAGETQMPREIRDLLETQLWFDTRLYDAARRKFYRDFARLREIAGGENNVDGFLDATALPRDKQ